MAYIFHSSYTIRERVSNTTIISTKCSCWHCSIKLFNSWGYQFMISKKIVLVLMFVLIKYHFKQFDIQALLTSYKSTKWLYSVSNWYWYFVIHVIHLFYNRQENLVGQFGFFISQIKTDFFLGFYATNTTKYSRLHVRCDRIVNGHKFM